MLMKAKHRMTFSCPSLSHAPLLHFLLFSKNRDTPATTNHQQSAAVGPVGTGFGKRVPEMGLINSLRGREQGRDGWGRRNSEEKRQGRRQGVGEERQRDGAVAKRKTRKKRRR